MYCQAWPGVALENKWCMLMPCELLWVHPTACSDLQCSDDVCVVVEVDSCLHSCITPSPCAHRRYKIPDIEFVLHISDRPKVHLARYSPSPGTVPVVLGYSKSHGFGEILVPNAWHFRWAMNLHIWLLLHRSQCAWHCLLVGYCRRLWLCCISFEHANARDVLQE